MTRRARGLCPVCAEDVSENPSGGARAHGGRVVDHRTVYCPGTGSPLAARYDQDDPPPPAPAATSPVEPAQLRGLRDELTRAGRERDDYRAENMRLAHIARMMLDANRHQIEASRMQHQSGIHLCDAQLAALRALEIGLPTYPNT